MEVKQANNTITRRDVVKNAAIAIGGITPASLGNIPIIIENQEKPLFTFVQLNDTHLRAPERPGGYEKSLEKLEHVIDTINREKRFPLPGFVIVTGDMIDGEDLRYLRPELEIAKGLLARLRCPYHTVVGNHENIQQEGSPVHEAAYEKVFGKDKINYYFTRRGYLFVCLNNSNACGDDENNPTTRKRNQWLKTVLNTLPQSPTIITCHIPLLAMRDEAVLQKSFGFPTYKMIGDGTWNIIRKHKKNVVAIICGHTHLTSITQKDGIFQICPSGTASYPCHYAHFTAYHNRIEVQMHQVAKDLVTPSTNLHGKPRYEQGFTDSTHKTPEEYVSGTKAEQRYTIPVSQPTKA